MSQEDVRDALEMTGKGYDNQDISDLSDLRKYRIELPNLYDDLGLDVYEFRLLAHYKRVGVCTESTRTTSEKCQMSPSSISEKRKSLADKKLIELIEVPLKNGKMAYKITVLDRWLENFNKYLTCTHSAHDVRHTNRDVRHTATKKEHIKKEPTKNNNAQSAAKIPEIALYREVTDLYPSKEVFGLVVESINKIRGRLGRDVTKEDLKPFRLAWVTKGYNRFAITWLEWAETGQVPANGNWKPKNETNAGIGSFLARHNGNPS